MKSKKLAIFLSFVMCVSLLISSAVALAAEPSAADPQEYTQKDLNEQYLMPLLWQQTAAEYRELCYQAYNVAQMQVDQALAKQKKGDKPLAIIVDCDETVIDNSAYDAGHIGYDTSYSRDTWIKWNEAARADAMPGAAEFLQYLSSKNVEVFYVTNRDARTCLEGTMENLKNIGFPYVDQKHVLLQTTTGNKQIRFDAIAKDYNVVVYMGDNANDMPIGTYHKNMEERNQKVDKNKALFGTKFVVLPNAAYGDWESALADNYWGLTAKQKDEERKAHLRTWRADQQQ